MKANVGLWSLVTMFVGVFSENSCVKPQFRSLRQHNSTVTGEDLGTSVQILCSLFNSDSNSQSELAVMKTWGRRCTNMVFSRRYDGTPHNSYSSWLKYALKYVVDYEYANLDWVLFAQHNSFVVIENLRYILAQHDPALKLAFGYRKKHQLSKGGETDYLVEDIGFVLSRAAVRAIVTEGFSSECKELFDKVDALQQAEILGPCFKRLGVEIIDTRDCEGGHRFLPYKFTRYMKLELENDIRQGISDSYYTMVAGPQVVADDFIATAVTNARELYLYEFLTHELQSFKKVFKDMLEGHLEESKVLCLVNITHELHSTTGLDIKNTWGKRCTRLLFSSDADDADLPSVNLADEGNDWNKFKKSLFYVYENYLNDVDWVVLAESESFLFYENLKVHLSQYDPSTKLVFGCYLRKAFNDFLNGLVTKKCVRVLSKVALRAIIEDGMKVQRCKDDSQNHDSDFNQCLHDTGVMMEQTKDSLGRYRFLPASIEVFSTWDTMMEQLGDWFFYYSYHRFKVGRDCCSPSLISLNKIGRFEMYGLDFFGNKFKRRDVVPI